jgi:hypothetical protein
MLGERLTLPTAAGWTPVQVISLVGSEATVTILDTGVEFEVPVEILPEGARVGDQILLKAVTENTKELDHTAFAQRLLEEIIN